MSLHQVAAQLNISQSMVRKIEAEAIAKLRYHLDHHGLTLRDFLGADAGTDEIDAFAGIEAPEVNTQ